MLPGRETRKKGYTMSSMFLDVWKSSHALVETMYAKATIGKIDVSASMSGDSGPLGIFGGQQQQYSERYSQFRG